MLEETGDVIGPHAMLVADDVTVFGTHAPTDAGAGEVVALGTADGGERWRLPLSPSLGEHGFARNGSDVIVHGAGRLAAVDLGSGEVRWDTTLSAPPVGTYSLIATSPAVGGGLVLALPRVTQASPGEGVVLVGLDAATGEERWSQTEPPRAAALSRARSYAGLGALASSPALVGEDLSVLDPGSGQVRRTVELGLRAGSPFVALGAGVVLVDDDGRVRHVMP